MQNDDEQKKAPEEIKEIKQTNYAKITIEQNRRTKLERFNSDKIATISGAIPILHTTSELPSRT